MRAPTELQEDYMAEQEKKGFFKKIVSGLSKTRQNIMHTVESVLTGRKIDEELFEELEEALILADVGAEMALFIVERLRERVRADRIADGEGVKAAIVEIIREILVEGFKPLEITSPAVILIIGVNGVGKTTSIGKLAANFASDGKKVMLAAADTFRAAAIDQLEVWACRAGVPLIKHQENSDPGAVVFDAVAAAKARNIDYLICDTAGRLHNKKNLMEELRKITKIIQREYDNAHVETWLVLDATTGQNALSQAKIFDEIAGITGIILTKLDGTAKGGIVVSISKSMNIPIRFIGVGEQIEDLQPFDPHAFAQALFFDESAENADSMEE